MQTQTVTEETARSSDEDVAAAPAKEDDGLSRFEQALLLGLGAVVVGSVLENGDRVVERSGDRVVVEGENGLRVLRDDNALLRRPGSEVRTETFSDGSTRTTVTRPDGTQVVTIAAADGRVIQRIVTRPDGTETVLIDDRRAAEPVDTAALPTPRPAPADVPDLNNEAALRAALEAEMAADVGRAFSLGQVRELRAVRELAPTIEVDAVTFETGSAAIAPSEAEELVALGRAIADLIADDPRAVILVEGHTDAVGSAATNLALSDRRAESVALALTEYFDVPPENLVTQGYGEAVLKVPTDTAERANRRAMVRNITPLLR